MISFLKHMLFFLLIATLAQSSFAQLMSEYTRKTGQLNILERKVSTSKEEIKGEISLLGIEKDESKQKQIFEDIKKNHEAYLSSVKEYNTVREDLKYKFPKKHDTTIRRYLPLREQTLDEIEHEVGIESVLTRVKKKLDKKYRSFTEENKTPEEEAKDLKKAEKEEKPKLKLVK